MFSGECFLELVESFCSKAENTDNVLLKNKSKVTEESTNKISLFISDLNAQVYLIQ